MKHILEYEEHELRDLLSDLEGVGQSTKSEFRVNVVFSAFRRVDGSTPEVEFDPIYTSPFWTIGDKEKDSQRALDLIREGKFKAKFPTVDKQSLENGSRWVMDLVEPEALMWRAQSFSTLEEFLDSLLRDLRGTNKKYIKRFEPRVRLTAVLAPVGDSELLLGNSSRNMGDTEVRYKYLS